MGFTHIFGMHILPTNPKLGIASFAISLTIFVRAKMNCAKMV